MSYLMTLFGAQGDSWTLCRIYVRSYFTKTSGTSLGSVNVTTGFEDHKGRVLMRDAGYKIKQRRERPLSKLPSKESSRAKIPLL